MKTKNTVLFLERMACVCVWVQIICLFFFRLPSCLTARNFNDIPRSMWEEKREKEREKSKKKNNVGQAWLIDGFCSVFPVDLSSWYNWRLLKYFGLFLWFFFSSFLYFDNSAHCIAQIDFIATINGLFNSKLYCWAFDLNSIACKLNSIRFDFSRLNLNSSEFPFFNRFNFSRQKKSNKISFTAAVSCEVQIANCFN